MRLKKNSILLTAGLFGLAWLAFSGLLGFAEAEKTVQDSMKRFTVQVPQSWQAKENAEENSMTITGDEGEVVISPVFRGTNVEELQRRMATPWAFRSLAGPPKKNKIKWEKREIGNLKALESDYDVKPGPDDKYKSYRIRVITIDGKEHKFCIVVTMPMELLQKNDLEKNVSKMVDSFKETD